MNELILKYKDVSLKILDTLKNENINEAEALFASREEIIRNISNVLTEENKKMNISDIISIDREISESLNVLKANVKEQMKNLKKQRDAQNIYGKQFENIYFINKQI